MESTLDLYFCQGIFFLAKQEFLTLRSYELNLIALIGLDWVDLIFGLIWRLSGFTIGSGYVGFQMDQNETNLWVRLD